MTQLKTQNSKLKTPPPQRASPISRTSRASGPPTCIPSARRPQRASSPRSTSRPAPACSRNRLRDGRDPGARGRGARRARGRPRRAARHAPHGPPPPAPGRAQPPRPRPRRAAGRPGALPRRHVRPRLHRVRARLSGRPRRPRHASRHLSPAQARRPLRRQRGHLAPQRPARHRRRHQHRRYRRFRSGAGVRAGLGPIGVAGRDARRRLHRARRRPARRCARAPGRPPHSRPHASAALTWGYRLLGRIHPGLRAERRRYRALLARHAGDGRYIEARLFVLQKPLD